MIFRKFDVNLIKDPIERLKERKRRWERTYYRRHSEVRARKIARVKAWKLKNPDKVKTYQVRQQLKEQARKVA